MAKYVDGFVVVVPLDKVEEYKKMAEYGREMWLENGALEYYECRGNDLKPQEMGDEKTRLFTEMAGASSEETVWFSYIVFRDKKHRDEVNESVMESMKEEGSDTEMQMPFVMSKMAYGGFEVVVEGKAK